MATAFVDFLCHLVSANGNLVEPCIRVLVTRLLPPQDPAEQLADGLDDCVHGALEQVLRIFPASSSCLAAVLRENFPHKRHSSQVHVTFLRNMLRILDDSPGLYEHLLTCIVDKCIQLDVDIKLYDRGVGEEDEDDDDDDDEDEGEEAGEDDGHLEPFEMDEEVADQTETNAAAPAGTEATVDMVAASPEQPQPADSTAEKLDLMLDMLFEFTKRQCRNRHSEAGQQQSDDLFRAMMRVFNSIILRTHQSKFVQYLMFCICGIDSAFMDSFLGAISAAVLCKDESAAKTPMDMRLVCSAYMSSFMGRASFVPAQRVREELDGLVRWAHAYIAENKEAAAAAGAPAAVASRDSGAGSGVTVQPPVQAHRLFYSVLQTIFYVVAFRHKQLLQAEDSRTWMRSLDLRRLISSWLKPLTFCSPDICRIFVRIVRDAKVIDCTAEMEEASESWSTQVRYAGTASLLQTFFPFDPYQLPISIRHVHAVGYLRYRDCIGEEVRTPRTLTTMQPLLVELP